MVMDLTFMYLTRQDYKNCLITVTEICQKKERKTKHIQGIDIRICSQRKNKTKKILEKFF